MSAMNQKPNEAGWFYHAPAKKSEHKEPVGAPPASQIPGLGEVEVLEVEEPKEMVFRDTDTKYIRMAKMGGRKDLLAMRENPNTKKEPVGYHRSEWYYLEDNAIQDREQKDKEAEEWKFLLPEYMVHQSHGQTTVDQNTAGVPMRRPPYATETQSQFQREGQSMTDKTVKIPEARRPGYGVRSGKPAPKGPRMPERVKPLSSQVQGERPKLRHQPMPQEPEEPVNMNKLLAGSYEREWHAKHEDWQKKQDRNREKSQVFTKGERRAQSEYNNNYQPSSGSQRSQRAVGSGNRKGEASRKEEEKKEPFKMSKFKNIPARIDTHQSPEILAAVGN